MSNTKAAHLVWEDVKSAKEIECGPKLNNKLKFMDAWFTRQSPLPKQLNIEVSTRNYTLAIA
jgi:hypothetical protein